MDKNNVCEWCKCEVEPPRQADEYGNHLDAYKCKAALLRKVAILEAKLARILEITHGSVSQDAPKAL